MIELKAKVATLNQLIINGDTLKAMEIFYADDIEMQENEEVPRKGKIACLDHEKNNLNKIKDLASSLINQAIDVEKGIVFSEWNYQFTLKDNSKFSLTEISIQHWLNGQVSKEKFYYKSHRRID